MTKIIPFRRRKKRKGNKWPRLWQPYAIIALSVLAYAAVEIYQNGLLSSDPAPNEIVCSHPRIIDGDTFDCGGTRIRLAGIDTPEMPGHCRQGRGCTPGDPYAAKDELINLTRGEVICRKEETDVYGRAIARCKSKDVDLSCAMLSSDHAVRRYGYILCL